MILLLVLACPYPAFQGDTDPSDTDPVDTDTDPVDTDTDPVDTDPPMPCGEEPLPTSTVELDTNDALIVADAFAITAGGPGELLVLQAGQVARLQVTRTGTRTIGAFDAAGGVVDAQVDAFGDAGDLDGDGQLDLLLWRSGAACVVHLHAFEASPAASIAVGTSARGCAVVQDVTGDDHADLLVVDLLLGGIRPGIGIWDGATLTPGSTPWASYVLEDFAFGSLGPARIVNLDGDDTPELVFATGGEPSGQDAPAVAVTATSPGQHTLGMGSVALRSLDQGLQPEASLMLGDWDGDGDLDPAGAFWAGPDGAGSLLGQGAEAPASFAQALFRWEGPAPTELARSAAGVGDFDGGGCDDLAVVVPGGSTGRIGIYSGTSLRGDLAAVLPAVAIAPVSPFLLGRGLVAPGDLDGDGAPDLVALGWSGSTVGLLTAHIFFGHASSVP
jgi:hypothetical protein